MGDNWPKHVTVAGLLVRKDEGAVGDDTIDRRWGLARGGVVADRTLVVFA